MAPHLNDKFFNALIPSSAVVGQYIMAVGNPDGTSIGSATGTIQGNVAHDSVDSGNPTKIGGWAQSPTAFPTAVAIGDRVNASYSTQGEAFVYNTRLNFDEDSTNFLSQVALKPVAVNTYTLSKDVSSALEASSVAKASAGNFYHSFGVIDATAPTGMYYVQFLDAASPPSDGAVTHLISPIPVNHTNGIDSSYEAGPFLFGVAAANGIVKVLSTTLVTKTIAGSYMFGTVYFK